MILTLDETIAREEDIVASDERYCAVAPSESAEAYHSATYHRQIAEWLKEVQERKTGKWIRQGGIHNMYTRYACSECGREIDMYYDFGNIPTDADVINEFPYCHCGAKMEVDDANSN